MQKKQFIVIWAIITLLVFTSCTYVCGWIRAAIVTAIIFALQFWVYRMINRDDQPDTDIKNQKGKCLM
jgi:hypothetical protein